MKKFLSLVLALVMTMSLVTVSAGAKDFTDDDKIKYDEAVNVMSEVGVIDGYTDGSFQPTTNLTRGAAAKIICNLILGPTTAAALGADTAPYSDVPTTNVFAGYIAYCQKTGIISGYADGTFKPSAPLTGYAFMKMLLGALGYQSDREGYTGANWSVNVAKQAIAIGLNKGNDDFTGQAYVNREEAMLYAFNTMNATMVEYEQNASIVINGGTQVTVQSPAKDKAWGTGTLNDGNIKKDGFVQFAEEYFTKLKLNNGTDAFGRPAREWVYDGKKVGTYVKSDLLVAEYTTEVTGKDLYDLLGKSTLDKYTTHVYVDGETSKDVLGNAYFTAGNLVRTNTEKVGQTGNGVLTQVYRDSANEEITIAIINTYVAVATEDYDTKNENVSLTVWGIEAAKKNQYVKNVNSSKKVDFVASAEDFDVKGVSEKDVFLVNVAGGALQVISAPEVIKDAEITAFKQNSSLTTGGTKYSYSDTACYDGEALGVYTSEDGKAINLKDTTYNVILDSYGYVIGVKENDPAENWLFVTGYDGNYSNLSNKTASVGVIFMDGSMKTIQVNVKKSSPSLWDDSIKNAVPTGGSAENNHAIINTWCSYTVNDEGVYTLQVAELQNAQDATGGVTIDKKHVSLDKKTSGKVYGNDDTVYLNVSSNTISIDKTNTAMIIDDVESVTVGVKNVNLEVKDLGNGNSANDFHPQAEIYTLYKSNGYITAAVVIGENQGVSTNYVYVTSNKVSQESYDKTSKEYTWSREVVVNGKLTEITYKGDTISVINPSSSKDGSTNDTMDQGYWYKVSYYADGTVKSAEALKSKFTASNDEYIDEVKNIESSFDNGKFDVGVLWDDSTVTKLTYKNGTLYTDETQSAGFSVSPEVKVILCLAGKDGDGTGTDAFNDVDASYTGYSGLEKALRNLNSTGKVTAGHIEVSAILEGGVATSIIINDKTANTSVNTGSDTPESATYKLAALFDAGKLKFTVETQENSSDTAKFDWKVTAQNTTSGFTYTAESGSSQLDSGSGSAHSTKEITTNVQAGSGIIFYTVTVQMQNGDTLTATLMG